MGMTRRRFVAAAGAVAAGSLTSPAFGQRPMRIRKPINQLTTVELGYFRRGVDEMMRRNSIAHLFTRSWEFQANIHGVESNRWSYLNWPQFRPYWNQCQHGNLFFLPWHRMYLYFFERILAVAS